MKRVAAGDHPSILQQLLLMLMSHPLMTLDLALALPEPNNQMWHPLGTKMN
jgi:hypothetical protein